MIDCSKDVSIAPAAYGHGIFARRPFTRHERIGRVKGQIIVGDYEGSDYCMDLGGNLCLEPHAPFRFVNHSCEPNCELVHYDIDDEAGEFVAMELWIEAIRPIESGQQLTIDYGWDVESAIRCRCGSPNCRGWIVAAEQTHLLPRCGE